jgi:hypothetical protein
MHDQGSVKVDAITLIWLEDGPASHLWNFLENGDSAPYFPQEKGALSQIFQRFVSGPSSSRL